MRFLAFILFASCAAAGVTGGRTPVNRPLWSGSRPSRDQVIAGFKYHEHTARHADAVRRPAWNRRGPVTKQALEDVKFYADKVARDAQTALSAGAPFKADPTETEEYWRSRETPASTEAWPSVTEVLGQAVSGIHNRWAAVVEAVQTRASDAVEHAEAPAEEYAEMTKRDPEAYGPAKRVKLHQPRELVYDRYDHLVEDEEAMREMDVDEDQGDDLNDELDFEFPDSDSTNVGPRDAEADDDEDRDELDIQDSEAKVLPDWYNRAVEGDDAEAEHEILVADPSEDHDLDAEASADEDEYEPTAATTQPPPAEPQPAPAHKKHGHGAHRH